MKKKKLLIATAMIMLLLTFAFRYKHKDVTGRIKIISRQEAYKNKLFVQCSPDWKNFDLDSLASGITILPGWGNYKWDIASASDSARLYFQQGINMYYSFHLIEAMASFKKAAKFDDKNAMIAWAEALAYGPNINDFAYSSTPDAFAAADKALALSGPCTLKEKALIEAMSVRYTLDTSVSRASLNEKYTRAMESSYAQFRDDADIAALYADAMMLQHPWEYWKHNGESHPWTPSILQVLEKALKKSPLHPGANHYYIHMVEASPHPERALASADRLASLLPSVSHMVHMPSHIYIRSGLYDKGIRVNEMSLKGYEQYLAAFPDVANNAPLYLIHNLHMQTACAMMGTGYTYSANAAIQTRASFDTSFMSFPAPLGEFIQYVYMTPVINNVRFGKWQAILDSPEVSKNYIYANTLWHWAKGMALAKQNNLAEAGKELKYMRENMKNANMQVIMQPFNAPVDAARVAEKLLEGIIAEKGNDLATAAATLREAIKYEDSMIYNEPKDWILPIRPYLGSVLMKSGAFSEAEKIFKEDLRQNPNNHWSLKGLNESLQKQNKSTEAAIIKNELDKHTAADMKDIPMVY